MIGLDITSEMIATVRTLVLTVSTRGPPSGTHSTLAPPHLVVVGEVGATDVDHVVLATVHPAPHMLGNEWTFQGENTFSDVN